MPCTYECLPMYLLVKSWDSPCTGKASTSLPELSTWPFLGIEREEDQVHIDESLMFPPNTGSFPIQFVCHLTQKMMLNFPSIFLSLIYVHSVWLPWGHRSFQISHMWFKLGVLYEITELLINKSTMRVKRQFVLGIYSLLQWKKDNKNVSSEKMSLSVSTKKPVCDVRSSTYSRW